jgi:hypothetical protein
MAVLLAASARRAALRADAGRVPVTLNEYESGFIPKSMRIGEGGQVTIPKDIRERWTRPGNGGGIPGRPKLDRPTEEAQKPQPQKVEGPRKSKLAELGYSSVDRFIEDIPGR